MHRCSSQVRCPPRLWAWGPVAALLLLGSACRTVPVDPPAGYAFAAATQECGPADGPAVAIFLAGDSIAAPDTLPRRHVRIFVWHGVDELRDRPWNVGGGAVDGTAEFHPDTAGSVTASRGTLTVHRVNADGSIEGAVNLAFDPGPAMQGGFRAWWMPRTVYCG